RYATCDHVCQGNEEAPQQRPWSSRKDRDAYRFLRTGCLRPDICESFLQRFLSAAFVIHVPQFAMPKHLRRTQCENGWRAELAGAGSGGGSGADREDKFRQRTGWQTVRNAWVLRIGEL